MSLTPVPPPRYGNDKEVAEFEKWMRCYGKAKGVKDKGGRMAWYFDDQVCGAQQSTGGLRSRPRARAAQARGAAAGGERGQVPRHVSAGRRPSARRPRPRRSEPLLCRRHALAAPADGCTDRRWRGPGEPPVRPHVAL